MDLRLSAEQDQLVDTFAALYAREAASDRVRAAEPLGFDKALWEHLTDVGVVTMAVPQRAGGWGASLLDLALIAEQQGRWVAPAPVIETQTAARLLASIGADAPQGITTLALHPPIDGVVRLMPAAAIADGAIVYDDDDGLALVAIEDDDRTLVENLGSMPVADVRLSNGEPLIAGGDAVRAWRRAIDEFAVLSAAAVVGMGARAIEITAAYVRERRAWGQPIGSFQGVAHRLADMATLVDGARLLTWEAAWSADDDPDRFPELAAMAFGFASGAARDATYWAVHLHGGYGFMVEHDLQLFYRRARAWTRVLASPTTAYGWVADRRYGAP